MATALRTQIRSKKHHLLCLNIGKITLYKPSNGNTCLIMSIFLGQLASSLGESDPHFPWENLSRATTVQAQNNSRTDLLAESSDVSTSVAQRSSSQVAKVNITGQGHLSGVHLKCLLSSLSAEFHATLMIIIVGS